MVHVGLRSAVARPKIDIDSAAAFTAGTTLGASDAMVIEGPSLHAIRSVGGTANTLTVYADFDGTGTYTACNDSDGNAITITIGTSDTEWHVLKPEVFAFTHVKFVANATEDATLQLAGRG